MNIVAIGGGEIRERETLAIDQWIVRLTKKRKPRALFVPTASGDAQGYCETFDNIYGEELGCKTDHLLLLSNDRDAKQIEKKVLGADVIYVGGGNTLRMMKLWRKLGVVEPILCLPLELRGRNEAREEADDAFADILSRNL